MNVILGVGFAVLLFLDYSQELHKEVARMQVALAEEATTLLPAVAALRGETPRRIQALIDTVCGRMQESSSPGHHILVEFGSQTFQARAHHRESPEIAAAMHEAERHPGHVADYDNDSIVVASAGSPALAVFISERVSNLRREVRRRAWGRAAALVGLALLVAMVINLVLLRFVVRPVNRLVATVRALGSGRLEARAGEFQAAELRFLACEVNAMGASLEAAATLRRRELERARAIQAHLCSLPGRVAGVRLASLQRPAEEVGGDYFDLFALPGGDHLLCLADATGHGVPAALEAAMLKALLAAATARYREPHEILEFVNLRFESVTLAGDFATLALLRFGAAGAVRYASAGHEPMILLRPGSGPIELTPTGMVVGVAPDACWETRDVPLESGDRILLVTDGVTESRSPEGRFFGLDGAARHFARSARLPLRKALEAVSRAAEEHRAGRPQLDDITLLGVESARARRSASQEPESIEDHRQADAHVGRDGGPEGRLAGEREQREGGLHEQSGGDVLADH